MKRIRLMLCAVILVFSMLVSVSCTQTVTDDIHRTDIRKMNADVGYSSESEKVVSLSASDVNKLIEVAKETYAKNDIIVISEDKTIDPVNVPSITLQSIAEMGNEYDPMLDDYLIYIGDTLNVIESMLKDILPESAVLEMNGKTNFPYPNYYFFDLEKTGFESAEDVFDKIQEDNSSDVDGITDCVYVLNGSLYYYYAETDESDCLYPNAEERELINAIYEKRQTADNSDPNYLIDKYAKSAEK